MANFGVLNSKVVDKDKKYNSFIKIKKTLISFSWLFVYIILRDNIYLRNCIDIIWSENQINSLIFFLYY